GPPGGGPGGRSPAGGPAPNGEPKKRSRNRTTSRLRWTRPSASARIEMAIGRNPPDEDRVVIVATSRLLGQWAIVSSSSSSYRILPAAASSPAAWGGGPDLTPRPPSLRGKGERRRGPRCSTRVRVGRSRPAKPSILPHS